MTEPTAIQKLDEVLNFLYKEHEYQHKIKGVHQEIKLKLDQPTVHKILDKLVKDGFALLIDVKYETPVVAVKLKDGELMKASEYTYTITFEGQLFKEQGGYAQKEINDNIRMANLETLEKIRKRNERLIVRGTIALAIGTFVLVAWEAFQWWFENFYCD